MTDNMRLVFNLTRFEMQYPNFIRQQASKIGEKEILFPIHARMRDFGYSEKIIQSTNIQNLQISSTGQITFDVVSDYRSELGFDVSEARERGTVRHFIKQINVKSLSFIVGGFIKAFSKGHWVKGITATNVIQKSIAELTPIAQQKLDEQTDSILQGALS